MMGDIGMVLFAIGAGSVGLWFVLATLSLVVRPLDEWITDPHYKHIELMNVFQSIACVIGLIGSFLIASPWGLMFAVLLIGSGRRAIQWRPGVQWRPGTEYWR